MKVLFSEKCLQYWQSGHPESPDRVKKTFDLLKRKNFDFLEPEPCSEKDLLLVHEKNYVETIKSGNFYDSDTPNLPEIFEYARLSVGSAIKAMENALEGEKAFSLMRPPGHHAGRNGKALYAPSLGFCYFNNVAIATKKALNSVKKVAIIDIDCHHGNGTQDIFFDDKRVLYVSLHLNDFYPGTGRQTEKNCINFPLPFGVDEKTYFENFSLALKEVKKFNPDLIAVSAGFDGHKKDPLTMGGLGLNKESYRKIGESIARLEKPSFVVLEGGYGKEFPECVYEFLIGYSKKE
jgi:acetoin utilization deacetylase AcuC-like enzyme